MESNKDEAERCIEIAEKFIGERNKEMAEKFLKKAERLFPSQIAKDLLFQVSLYNDYTSEEMDLVEDVNFTLDYYTIFDVEQGDSDEKIRQAYVELAYDLHPDNNKAPGAAKAYEKLAVAYSILSDPVKRKMYDLYRPDDLHTIYFRISDAISYYTYILDTISPTVHNDNNDETELFTVPEEDNVFTAIPSYMIQWKSGDKGGMKRRAEINRNRLLRESKLMKAKAHTMKQLRRSIKAITENWN